MCQFEVLLVQVVQDFYVDVGLVIGVSGLLGGYGVFVGGDQGFDIVSWVLYIESDVIGGLFVVDLVVGVGQFVWLVEYEFLVKMGFVGIFVVVWGGFVVDFGVWYFIEGSLVVVGVDGVQGVVEQCVVFFKQGMGYCFFLGMGMFL